MGGPAVDPVQRPLQVIDNRFQQACQQTKEAGNEHPQDCSWVVNAFSTVLEKPDTKAPWLNEGNVDSFPPNTLVRFSGVVQDLLDPEYYGGIYRTASGGFRTGAYRESIDDDVEDHIAIWERKLMVIAPVDFESEWMKARYLSMQTCPASPSSCDSIGAPTVTKRDRESEDGDEQAVETMETDSAVDCKRTRNGAVPGTCQDDGKSPTWACHLTKNSILVKTYDRVEFKLGDIVEGLAVLSRGPPNAGDDGQSNESEIDAPLPPESFLPRLHAVQCYKSGMSGADWQENSELQCSDVQDARDALLDFWSLPFGCDRLFAEQVLLSCLSKASDRENGDILIGKNVLNIWNCPSLQERTASDPDRFAAQLLESLRSVFPYVQYLPLSLQVLENGGSMLPKKDYELNRLLPGKLLLPQGCLLVIDERVLSEGNLGDTGCRNLEAVQDLCANLKIDLDFKYYKTSLAMDVSIIILSQARCRLLSSDSNLRLHAFTPEAFQPLDMAASPETIRRYVRLCASLPLPSIDPARASQLEEDIVKSLQGASGDDRNLSKISYGITCARLLARSYCERSVSMERWHQMREIEHSRLCRDDSTTSI